MSLRQYCIEHGRDTLLREWDAARNGGLTPSDVSFGSHQKVWWQCSKGHSWQAKVYSRSEGSGCPYCTGRKEVPENSLAVQVPSLEAEWDAEKNAPLKFADLTVGSHKKVWWRCPAGHSYCSEVKSRVQGTGCPVCAGRVVLPDENSLAAKYPALVAEWDTEKNAPLLPTLVAPGTVRKAWWRCPKGHSYRAAISSRAGGGTGCPFCAGQKVIQGENDLATQYPQLAAQWDRQKNGALTPEAVTSGSNRRVWWRCEKGHSYPAVIAHRVRSGSDCPYCSNHKVLPGFNDLATIEPVVASHWHPTRNGSLTPQQVTPGSRRKVWWLCDKGHAWRAVVNSRTGKQRCGCPICAGRPLDRCTAILSEPPAEPVKISAQTAGSRGKYTCRRIIMKHKLLSILLSLSLVISLLPTVALADEGTSYTHEDVVVDSDGTYHVSNEEQLRRALYYAPTNGTQRTIMLTDDISLEMTYTALLFAHSNTADKWQHGGGKTAEEAAELAAKPENNEIPDNNTEYDTLSHYKIAVNGWDTVSTDLAEQAKFGANYPMNAVNPVARLVVKAGQNVIIDLNGKTIAKRPDATHGNWGETDTDIIGNYGTLTITDTSTGEKGTIRGRGYNSCGGAVLHNYAGATMTVEAVNVDGNAMGMSAGTGQYVISNEGGMITIDGANVYDNTTENVDASLINNVSGTMTVKGNATLNHPNTKTINAKGGEVILESATIISDNHAIYAKGGTTNITGNVTIKASAADETAGTLTIAGGAITKAENVSLPAPSGYTWTKVGNTGVLVKEDSAAVVNGVGYATLAEAINAAGNGDTVTLLKDVKLDSLLEIRKDLTLDLGGKKLSRNRSVLDIYSNVTIQNGTIETTFADEGSTAAVWVNNTAKLTVASDVTMSTTTNAYALAFDQSCTAAEVTFKGTVTGGNGIAVNGLITGSSNNKLTMDGANITVSGHGIYQAGCANTAFSIENSTISGATGIEVRAGKLTVNNSAISGSGAFKSEANSGGPTTDGAGIAIVQHTTNLPIDVTISGGSISGPMAIYQATKQSENTDESIANIKLSVTGGEFTGNISSENPKKFVSGGSFSTDLKGTGYLADSVGAEVKSADGSTYGYYANIGDAMAAAKPGDTVTDLTVSAEQKVTLTLKYNDGTTADTTYSVANDTVVTLPTPTRSGYTFNGWYDGSTFYAAGASYTVSATAILTASWSYISSGSSSSDPTYSVSTPSKTENGTVTVSPKSASKGDTVTITVKPDSGYVLGSLTVTDSKGNELTLTDKGDGKYTFTMPSGRVEVKASFVKEIETSPFADVATDAYYYEAVKWAVGKGITTGVGDNLFAPEQPCTRAQIVTFLWRAAGSPEPKSMSSFSDVSTDSYYAKAVAWAVENGITTGTGDGKFSPDATCTRAQSVTFLYRAMGTAPTTVNGFTDVAADSFCADAVAWAVENGVTNGTSASAFSPSNGCTRAQIVTFLFRAYQGK